MSATVVLMYHRIGGGVLPGREAGEEIYAVEPAVFEAQLETLARCACPVVPFEELLRGPSPRRAVAISFDDGNASDRSQALPALVRRGYRAAFFITPAWVGTPGYLSWPEVRELADAGMTVGCHGLDHTPLSSLPGERLRTHLKEARGLMEARLGRAPEVLSLPGGFGGLAVSNTAREVGFGVVVGSAPRRFVHGARGDVPRYAVRRADRPGAFQALVEQRPLALLGARLRHEALVRLRAAVGPGVYRRVRALATSGRSAS